MNPQIFSLSPGTRVGGMSVTRVPALVVLVAALIGGCAPGARQVSTRQHVDDVMINTRVKEVIFADLVFKPTVIDVTTRDGTVRLIGYVDREADVMHATRVANRISGVTGVKNELKVRTP